MCRKNQMNQWMSVRPEEIIFLIISSYKSIYPVKLKYFYCIKKSSEYGCTEVNIRQIKVTYSIQGHNWQTKWWLMCHSFSMSCKNMTGTVRIHLWPGRWGMTHCPSQKVKLTYIMMNLTLGNTLKASEWQ